jgi:cell division protein FtsB
MRRETKTWVGRVLAAALVMFALGYIPYHVYSRSGLARTLGLQRDLASIRARNSDLRAENERLTREATALRDDLAAIERVARDELGWVRPGEIIVDLSPRPSSTSLGPPASYGRSPASQRAAARP